MSRESIFTSREETLLLRESTFLSRESIFTSREETLLSRESIFTSREETLLSRETTCFFTVCMSSYNACSSCVFVIQYLLSDVF